MAANAALAEAEVRAKQADQRLAERTEEFKMRLAAQTQQAEDVSRAQGQVDGRQALSMAPAAAGSRGTEVEELSKRLQALQSSHQAVVAELEQVGLVDCRTATTTAALAMRCAGRAGYRAHRPARHLGRLFNCLFVLARC